MKVEPGPYKLESTFLRLRGDVSVEPLKVDATFWQRISTGELGDFRNEYLVAINAFSVDWPMWEKHPNGDEVVCLLSGAVEFVLETSHGNKKIELTESGSYVIVPKGTWHTARTKVPTRMLFITAGEGTEHREISK